MSLAPSPIDPPTLDDQNQDMDQLTRRIVSMDRERLRMEDTLHSELDRLYMMQKIGNLINATFSLEQMLRVVATSLTKEMGFDRALLYLPVDGESELTCRTWQGCDSRVKDALSATLSRRIKEQSAETDLPCAFSVSDEGLDNEVRLILEKLSVKSLVITPVLSQHELVGGIIAGRSSASPVTAADMGYFSLLAKQTAIAIVNSRLYRRIEEYSRNLESEVSERTRELFSAYRDLQVSKETLVASEKMAFLGQLTAGIAHEINTPIGAVANSLKSMDELANELTQSFDSPEVTLDDYKEIVKEMRQSLDIASSAIQKAARFVRSVKAQTRDLANVEVRAFDTVQTIDDIRVLLQHELRKNNVTVELEPERDRDLTLVGDAGKFSQIFTNLINNAIDAYEGKEGTIWVRIKRAGEDVVIDVADNGCGISDANKKRLFKEMFTTKWQGKGTGLGTSIVYGLVTGAFGGTIGFESEVGKGTTFTVRMPRRSADEVKEAAVRQDDEAKRAMEARTSEEVSS
ncbi:MAG: GAF domain-containing protein [Proteobacteria bacterium]|nr:GAF domain-containing protein [Pseudomonadota bacterium]